MTDFLNMRNSIVASVSAHLLLIVFTQFGLPHFFTPAKVSVTIIPVELVTLTNRDAPPPPATPEPEPKPEAAPPPPEPKARPEPPAAPEEIVAPPPPEVKPKPPEKKPPEPPDEPKPKPRELAKAKPLTKPKPPAPVRDFSSVLKDLDRTKKKPAPTQERSEDAPKDKDEPAPQQEQIAEQASITEIERLRQMIRQQIRPCWSPPVGAADAEGLLVTILIQVDAKGFVNEARVANAPAMALNSFVQAAADAARRAVLNPDCQPFELPQNRYNLWKEIEFNFDPREMLG